MTDVIFTSTFSPRVETFGDFLTKILNFENKLPVDKYRVSYEDNRPPFEYVETGPLKIQVSDLIIPGDVNPGDTHGTIIGDPLTHVLSGEHSPEVVSSETKDTILEDHITGEVYREITGEVYREILVSVNDTVIGHFKAASPFPDETSPAFETIVDWLEYNDNAKTPNEALSTLSLAKNLLPSEGLKQNIPRSRNSRLALLKKLKGLESAKYPDAEDGGGFPQETPFMVKIEGLSKLNKEHPNEIELREVEKDFRRGLIDAGKGAGYSQEELEEELEKDHFASRREQLRYYQEAGQTTYDEYMKNYKKKIEQDLYEGLRDGLQDSGQYPQVDPALPTDHALRQNAQEAAQSGIDQIRKRPLPGHKAEERDEKRLKAEARMALIETKGDVRAAARLIKKWRASVGQTFE